GAAPAVLEVSRRLAVQLQPAGLLERPLAVLRVDVLEHVAPEQLLLGPAQLITPGGVDLPQLPVGRERRHEVERDREQPAAARLELAPLGDVVDESVEAPRAVQLHRGHGDLRRELASLAVTAGHLETPVEQVALAALEERAQARP